jgi:hypothetical protein
MLPVLELLVAAAAGEAGVCSCVSVILPLTSLQGC